MSGWRLPTVDVRALALCAVAVTPLSAWLIFDPAPWHDLETSSDVQAAFNFVFLVVDAFIVSFGCVFVALGGSLALQADQPLRTFRFKLWALVIGGVLTWIYVFAYGLGLASVSEVADNEYLSRFGTSILLNSTTTLASIAVATHLYILWRRNPAEQADSRRFAAIAAVGVTLTLAFYIADLNRFFGKLQSEGALLVFSLMELAANKLVGNVGIVFLFGSMAIAWLRRAKAERNLWSVMAAMVGAGVIYWLLYYGHYSYVFQLQLVELFVCVATGFVGGLLYLYALDRGAFRAALADTTNNIGKLRAALGNTPKYIGKLRRWPYRDSDD